MKGQLVPTTAFRKLLLSAASAALCISFAQDSQAGMITGVQMFGLQAGTGPGLGTVQVPVVNSFNKDNDNQVGGGEFDNNITVPIKRFDNPGYIDIVFNVDPTNGTTEYKLFESVDNNTGYNWRFYRMELGFGVGAGFVPSPAGDGLDFDGPTYDTAPNATAFTNVVLNEDVLLFNNGLHSTGAEFYQFRIDVPNLPPDVRSFTLRQSIPPDGIVPEPSTMILAALAGIGGLALTWRRRVS
ncbi:MAG: choice-of-anchor F family protein [Pirellulales bacterium]|nr:choice-of-anchor F family protein [Pirellulales bacterium]